MSGLVRRVVPVALLVATLACSRRDGGAPRPATGAAAAVPEHFQIAVTRSGGIAGMITSATIDGDTRRFTLSSGHPGAEVYSGELPEPSLREIARLVVDSLPELRADYGSTPRAADMFDYVVEGSWGSAANGLNSYTVHADDGTAPEPLRLMVARVLDAIERTRTP